MSGHSALFVIDLQNDLLDDPNTEIPNAAPFRGTIAKIIQAARKTQSQLIFVQHEESPESGPLQKGIRAWNLVFPPKSDVKHELLVAKTTSDTFESNAHLAAELKAHGIDHVVAIGIQSECCVEATCQGALAAGFQVTLLRGAHSTYDGKTKTATEIGEEVETSLESKGVKIVPWEDALIAWDRHGAVC